MESISVTCLCKSAAQILDFSGTSNSADNRVFIDFCHCGICRHVTGVPLVSFYPLDTKPSLAGLGKFECEDESCRYFCQICGCHMFRSFSDQGWGVATGTIISGASKAEYRYHKEVSQTKDGGFSHFIEMVDGKNVNVDQSLHLHTAPESLTDSENDVLDGGCLCGNVRFHITRPDQSSEACKSAYPDLMFAEYSVDAEKRRNSDDEKWWLQPAAGSPATEVNAMRFLSGTCCCRPCRLGSGFEVQSWAFIPRRNIFFCIDNQLIPLDFKALPRGVLQSYNSSPGVAREFCGKCGATVFWHNDTRPDLIDVSVGLLKSTDGVLARSWLKWWVERTSYTEDAELEREGESATLARALITELERSMKIALPWESS